MISRMLHHSVMSYDSQLRLGYIKGLINNQRNEQFARRKVFQNHSNTGTGTHRNLKFGKNVHNYLILGNGAYCNVFYPLKD